MTKTNVYVLKLEGGRYYVGKSDNVMKRYQEHLNGGGSAWTKKYTPVSLEKTIKDVSPFEEDKVTKEYMLKYGVDKVRGGAYVSIVLDDDQYRFLERELFAVQDKCVNCGRDGHFVKDCYAKTDVNGNSLEYEGEDDEDSEDDDSDKYDSDEEDEDTCYKCGREGHYANSCYAHTDVNGRRL